MSFPLAPPSGQLIYSTDLILRIREKKHMNSPNMTYLEVFLWT